MSSPVTVHVAPWVLPIAAPPIRDGAVALDRSGQVRAVGPVTALAPLGAVEEHDGVLLPGLVNAHLHLELSHLARLVPGGDGLVPWIRRVIALRPQGDDADPAPAHAAARAAAQAMAARGTVAVAEVTNEGRVAPLLAEAGLDALVLEERIAPRGCPAPAHAGGVATAHATYTCGAAALATLARSSDGRIASIHVEEDPAEAMWLVEGSGPLEALLTERGALPDTPPPRMRPVRWLDALGVLGAGTLLVHLTFADDASLELAARRGAVAVLCPRSNLHITGWLPPVERIRKAGLRTALGTDSLASAPSLDVLGEVAALARAGADPGWALACATEGGAHALGRPHLGALSPGLRPGLVVLGGDARRLADAAHAVAWAAHEGADAPARRVDRSSPGAGRGGRA